MVVYEVVQWIDYSEKCLLQLDSYNMEDNIDND